MVGEWQQSLGPTPNPSPKGRGAAAHRGWGSPPNPSPIGRGVAARSDIKRLTKSVHHSENSVFLCRKWHFPT